MELFYPVDTVVSDYNPRLPVADIQELNSQMNCNLDGSDESEHWLDFEPGYEMMVIIDETEFLRDI